MKKRRQKVAGEFNRDSFYKRDSHLEICKARGLGSVGRASRLHREGQRFESASLQNLNEGLLNLLLNRDIEPKATRADIKEE